MNNLASKVIQQQNQRKRAEDEAIAKYEYDREMRLRHEDERRAQAEADGKLAMRELLRQQMKEKQLREEAEKAHNDQQATIWRQDLKNFEIEEKRLKDKMKTI